MDSVISRERTPSFRYKLVRLLALVVAVLAVPMFLVVIGALVAGERVTFDGRALTFEPAANLVTTVAALVELALAIPIYRAITQRRRAGLLALLFAQVGVIMQKAFTAFTDGSWGNVCVSAIWLGILISIRDELDQ
ncbi:MAG: hypothetical protein K2R93_06560 [Gemmatimonadaceae bacterium]|nr:hypothetical protein [Gemmatimonadaceae bacterium]